MSNEMHTRATITSVDDQPIASLGFAPLDPDAAPTSTLREIVDSHVDWSEITVYEGPGVSEHDPKRWAFAGYGDFELNVSWSALSAALGQQVTVTVDTEWTGEDGPTVESTTWLDGERDRTASKVMVLLPETVGEVTAQLRAAFEADDAAQVISLAGELVSLLP